MKDILMSNKNIRVEHPTILSEMKFDPIETISRAAVSLAGAEGIRSGSALVVEHLTHAMSANIGFVALRLGDGDIADIVAANGLGAADFRRLESRLTKSGLWKILHQSSPFVIDNLSSEAVLNFLSFGTGARLLVAVTIVLRGSSVDLPAIGFPARSAVV